MPHILVKANPKASGEPSGAAGGVLSGAYPNPGLAAESVTAAAVAKNTITGKQTAVGVPAALKELKENTSIEANGAGATTTVYLSILAKAEETVGEIIVSGVPVYMIRKETLAASSDNILVSFRIKSAGKFEVKMTTGKIETEGTNKSVYTVQEG
jgi:hypothetical protein